MLETVGQAQDGAAQYVQDSAVQCRTGRISRTRNHDIQRPVEAFPDSFGICKDAFLTYLAGTLCMKRERTVDSKDLSVTNSFSPVNVLYSLCTARDCVKKQKTSLSKLFAPGEARTHGLQIMRLTRCLLRYGSCAA